MSEIEALKKTINDLREIIKELELKAAKDCQHKRDNGDEYIGGHCGICKQEIERRDFG